MTLSTTRTDFFAALNAANEAIRAGRTRRAAHQVQRARALAVLLLPAATPPLSCAECGIARATAEALAEHRYYCHGGALPEHWCKEDA